MNRCTHGHGGRHIYVERRAVLDGGQRVRVQRVCRCGRHGPRTIETRGQQRLLG